MQVEDIVAKARAATGLDDLGDPAALEGLKMLVKASRLGCGVVASRTSPTELAVSLAVEANIALCGYVRRDQLRVFHDAGRLSL